MLEEQNVIDLNENHEYVLSKHIQLRVIKNQEKILSRNFSNWYCRVIRFIDIFFSIFLMLAFIIVTPFIWLANKIFSPGPLFYSQDRVGKDGKIFSIYKFRSMNVDAEADGVARFAKEHDDRITRVGSFLRKSRIDELPQVINIFKGEMSLIGPRPERPEFVTEFIRREPRYQYRSLVKPGITGWGQVKYRYTSTLEEGLEKLEYDLYFMKNRNFKMDFQIICRTIYIVCSRAGT